MAFQARSPLVLVVQLSSERRVGAMRLTLLLPSRSSSIDLRACSSSISIVSDAVIGRSPTRIATQQE
jgi:hypothetical protein